MIHCLRLPAATSSVRLTFAMLLAGSILAAAQPALASGFYIQEQSARAAGRADSGEIADTGADSLWWNPAAIGGMTGGDATLNATAILPRARISDTGTLIVRPGQYPASVGGNPTTIDPIQNGVVPQGAIAHALTNQIAVGLAITAPYNFTTTYANDSFARYSALTTRLRTIDIQPTVALHFDGPNGIGVNIGGGVNVERASASFGNALPNLLAALPDGQQVLSGHGWDVGYSLGTRITAGPLSLGASYKSSIAHHLDGQIAVSGLLGPLAGNNATLATTARFATPWQLGVGARYQLTSRLTLDAEVIRFGWSKFSDIALGAPLNSAIPENYRNTWNYALGLDADLGKGWTARTGVQRDLSPVRDGQRDARVPDSNRWIFAAGASHELVKNLTIDGAFNYVTLHSAAIDAPTEAYAGTPVATPVLMSGEMTGAHVLIFSLGGRLRF
jgi:long-chain fatty acid transport protein